MTRARVHLERVGHGDDAVARAIRPPLGEPGPADRAHRLAEADPVAETLGEPERHLLQAADHALVEDEVGVDEVRERARRGGHEQRLQRRERVVGLGEHRPGDEHADVQPRLFVVGLRLEPVRERDLVELLGPGVRPRLVGVDLRDELVELLDEADDLALGLRRNGEDLALEEPAHAALVDVDVLALAVARVGLEAEVVERLDEGVLVGRDPLAADLEHGALDRVGPEPAADAVAGLEHDDRAARVDELGGGGEPGGAGPDDDDIRVDAFHDSCLFGLHPWPGTRRADAATRGRGIRSRDLSPPG